MTETTAPPENSPPLLKQSRLVELTSRGYSLHQVASRLLRTALEKRYPDQHIDPDHTLLATPIRDLDDPQMPVRAYDFESLSHALIHHGLYKTRACYVEGEHFLTRTPTANPPVHLAVDMDEFTALLNDHAPLLFIEYQQQQLDYWNESENGRPQWQELSDLLRSAVDVQSVSGWDADACRLGRFVALHPTKAERPTAEEPFTDLRACVMDIDRNEDGNTTHALIAGALVLTATFGQRKRVLMYTIADGYESFDSLAQLGGSLSQRVDPENPESPLTWRLIEPDGNIFDAFAQALIANQLVAIESLDPDSPSTHAQVDTNPHSATRFNPLEKRRFNQLQNAIPAWLKDAPVNDLQTYSDCITALGTLRDGAENDAFRDKDLPAIKPYAEQKMREAILADSSAEGAADLPLERLRITVTHSLETAGFTLPDPLDQVRETLGEFALQNTAPYMASIDFDDGRSVPAWLTVDYLTGISEKVDIGGEYPKLIRRTLIDDPVRAALQRTRYTLQLPILLSLLALECKLRRLGGVDAQGQAYIHQLMDSIASEQAPDEYPVTIRPLAFTPVRRLSGRSDTVANMFIIGPRNHRQGPCLLYRPMLDVPLMQFASMENLIYAVHQPGELRNSVLAWLDSPALSFEYAQYVFPSGLPSPWTLTQLAFEPLLHLDLTGPIKLANQPLTGDILGSLYTANSQAVIELADRQSVSNSERRWTLLADSGWAIFSVASNFISGAAGTAVWVWQTIELIQQAVDAQERSNNMVAWRSTADVLLALGILLTHRAISRRNKSMESRLKAARKTAPVREPIDDPIGSERPALPPPVVQITLDPLTIADALPSGHRTLLDPALLPRPDNSTRFKAMLDSFKVEEPDLTGKSTSPDNHLHSVDGKTYAPVGNRWFQVIALENEPVYIVHPQDPLRTGMALKYDTATGKWHWDPRLRLRGGGPTGRIEALRRAKEQKKTSAWQALELFMARESAEKRTLLEDISALQADASEDTFNRILPRYLDKAMKLGNDYTQALEQLDTWHQNGGAGVYYQAQLMRMTGEQHRCLGSWLRMKMRLYAKTSKKIAESFEKKTPLPRKEQIETATAATLISDEMITGLQTLQHSLQTLEAHAGKARKLAADLTRLMPNFTGLDLKANEIGMSYERCVSERPGLIMEAARLDIGILTIKAADAGHELIRLNRIPLGTTGQAERIEQLSHWNDLLTGIDERIAQLPNDFREQFVQARLDRVRELIGEFRALARERLIAEVPEPELEQPPATVRQEPQPSTSQPKPRVSKSRRRPDSSSEPSSSGTRQPEDEAPFVKISAHPTKPALATDSVEFLTAAMDLGLNIDNFNKSTRDEAKRPGRIPADIRDMFDQQIARLEQNAKDLDAALTRQRAANQNVWPVASLPQELREGAARTRIEAATTYGAMLKQRKPRETYFHWLYENAQVEVVKDPRGRIRTQQRGDYFQEYRILDRTNGNRPLWVAHFHYEKPADTDDHYTVAHLKFADAYLQTLDAKTRQALNTFDAVDNALRRIVDPRVRDLFLKPKPPKPED